MSKTEVEEMPVSERDELRQFWEIRKDEIEKASKRGQKKN